MTQKQQLIAMLNSSGTGYGQTDHWSGGVVSGSSVLVEAPRKWEEPEWYSVEFQFDNDGKLVEVFGYPGEAG